MLVGFILLYLAASIAVGLYAATRVRNASDYAVAAGRFGPVIVAATVFATWFGAETVLGIPATFFKDGLRGLVADPFAAVGCLVIIGVAFARPLHGLDCLTLGDYFRDRFDRRAELVLSLCIAFSYLGWIAAQLVALGLAFNVLSGGAIDMQLGIVGGAAIVLTYTMAGGMWSVALTDYLQAALIIAGLGYVAWMVSDLAGGAGRVLDAASANERMRFLPEAEPRAIFTWITAALVVAFGSVPQQDVFQRVRSARTASIAVWATIAGGAVYLVIASLPIFLMSAATVIDAPMVERLAARDPQLILPTLILERTPMAVQVLFFGALISAILSTAGGALLAPAVAIAENVIRPLAPSIDDRAVLRTMRLTVLCLGVAVTIMALTSKLSIYQLVNESGKVVLVSAFVPLAAGIYWRGANGRGAMASVLSGLVTWTTLEIFAPEATVPPAFAGLIASAIGMLLGSKSISRP